LAGVQPRPLEVVLRLPGSSAQHRKS
jgi:hypothetical protein